jgi:hypothetical protein
MGVPSLVWTLEPEQSGNTDYDAHEFNSKQNTISYIWPRLFLPKKFTTEQFGLTVLL